MKLLTFVKIIYSKEKLIKKALEELAAQLKERREVLDVYLCGSWAKGNYSPYSDVDLFILVSSSDKDMPHERIPEYLPDRFPVGLDLFIYTPEEVEKSSFAKELLKGSVLL